MKRIRSVALALAAVMMLAAAAPAAGAADQTLLPAVREWSGFSDTNGVWCEANVRLCYETGLLQGWSDGTFRPESTLTGGQVLMICARFYSLLHGGDGAIPPSGDGLYAAASAYLLGQGINPYFVTNGECPRWQFVRLLAQFVPEEDLSAINTIPSLPDAAGEAILRFYRAGVLNGEDGYGSFHPGQTLNRGQVAAILARVLSPALREQFTLKSFDFALDVLGTDGSATVMTVNGLPVSAEFYGAFLAMYLQRGLADDAAALAARQVVEFYSLLSDGQDSSAALTSAQQTQVQTLADADAGYLGLSRAYWLEIETHIAMMNNLWAMYGDKAGSLQIPHQITAWADAAEVTCTDACASLDTGAISRALQISPLTEIHTFYTPYRLSYPDPGD